MEDAIGLIIIYTFSAMAVVFPLFVVIQSIFNLVRATDGRGTIIIKALVVLGVWAVLSFIFVMIVFMYVFEVSNIADRAVASRRMTILSTVLTLIYIAAGLAMGYWVRLQPGWKTLQKNRGGI